MRNTNKVLMGILTIMLIVSLVACGPKPSAGPVTIHILTMDQAGLKPAEIDQIARDFEAKNPDIKVNMEYVGYDYVHDKIVTGMAAKPPAYDAAMIDVIWPDEFIKAGYLLDVTNRVTADMKANMFPASWNGVTRNGKIYGMPWLMDVKYFMYNKVSSIKPASPHPRKPGRNLSIRPRSSNRKVCRNFRSFGPGIRRKASSAISPSYCSATVELSWMPAGNRCSMTTRACRS
jgi:hypothetical protein